MTAQPEAGLRPHRQGLPIAAHPGQNSSGKTMTPVYLERRIVMESILVEGSDPPEFVAVPIVHARMVTSKQMGGSGRALCDIGIGPMDLTSEGVVTCSRCRRYLGLPQR